MIFKLVCNKQIHQLNYHFFCHILIVKVCNIALLILSILDPMCSEGLFFMKYLLMNIADEQQTSTQTAVHPSKWNQDMEIKSNSIIDQN